LDSFLIEDLSHSISLSLIPETLLSIFNDGLVDFPNI